ncbi:MAG: serine/threonine protein kinase [Clostridia bacterium]|nr:serine/threonine protein kinase [Clostridia bacterium]
METRLPPGWEDWTLGEVLGEGSYGTVYRATRSIGGATIESAVKVIQIPASESEAAASVRELGSEETARSYYRDMVDTFMAEIRAMNALKGITNIVSVEDCALVEHPDAASWTIFIRMELLTSFPDWAQTHPMTEADVIRLGIDVCTALDYCEKAGIIHRDIKPSNIFVSGMRDFKLGDFGVARQLDRTAGIYSSKGTFPFMAPEVFHSRPYDHRADICSLGLVLHRLMNRNREPFIDLDKQMVYMKDREKATARRMQGEALPAPVDASPALAKVILKACEFDPKKRYASAAEFREALMNVRGGAEKRTGRKRAAVIVPALAVLLVLAAAVSWIVLSGRKDSPAPLPVPAPAESPTRAPAPEPTASPAPAPAVTAVPEPEMAAALPLPASPVTTEEAPPPVEPHPDSGAAEPFPEEPAAEGSGDAAGPPPAVSDEAAELFGDEETPSEDAMISGAETEEAEAAGEAPASEETAASDEAPTTGEAAASEEPYSPRVIRLDGIAMKPLLLFNRLYSLQPAVPAADILRLLADQGCVWAADTDDMPALIAAQFAVVCEPGHSTEAPFAPGDTVTVVFRPTEAFEAFLGANGCTLVFEPQTYVAEEAKDPGVLVFSPAAAGP